MGRHHPNDPFDLEKLPSEEDISAFDSRLGPCCTVDNFRPDLLHTPGTPWNKSVADVFVEGYLKDGEFPCDDEALIRKSFVRHLKYLIDKFRASHSPEEIRARFKERRRKERRSYVSSTRSHVPRYRN